MPAPTTKNGVMARIEAKLGDLKDAGEAAMQEGAE